MSSKLADYLVSWDIYGHQLGVNYRGSGAYQTKMGAFCTLIMTILIMFNLTNLVVAFFDGSKQDVKTQTTKVDLSDSDRFILGDNGIVIAISMSPDITP